MCWIPHVLVSKMLLLPFASLRVYSFCVCPKIPVFAKKTALGEFDAKVFLEVRRTLIDVAFGEESESEVKMVKNP